MPQSVVPKSDQKKNKKQEQKRTRKSKTKKQQLIRAYEPSIDDIVWAKMRGYCLWPAKVRSIEGNSVWLTFYGDYTSAKLNRQNVFPFEQCIRNFTPIDGKKLLLQKAVKEALFAINFQQQQHAT